jgi:hypothetical protein
VLGETMAAARMFARSKVVESSYMKEKLLTIAEDERHHAILALRTVYWLFSQVENKKLIQNEMAVQAKMFEDEMVENQNMEKVSGSLVMKVHDEDNAVYGILNVDQIRFVNLQTKGEFLFLILDDIIFTYERRH